MQTTAAIDCLIREPADVYHAQAREYLSSHALADFRRCPLLYRRKQLGLIPDEDRPAYRLGRAAHTLILEGRARFEGDYAVGGPVNPSTGQPYGPRTKAYAEWAASLDKEVLTDSEAALIEQMNAGVSRSTIACSLLADGVPEGVVRAEYCGVACQARFDWVHPDCGHRRPEDLRRPDLPGVRRPPLRLRLPARLLPGAAGRGLRRAAARLPGGGGEARALPLWRLAHGRGRPGPGAEGERAGHRPAGALPGDRRLADALRGPSDL